jgi:capsular polysaccharide biosynthesis protein
MDLSDYWSALVRGWWLIVIFALGGLVVGLALPKSATPPTKYQSTSSMGAAPSAGPGEQSSALVSGAITPDQILYYASTDAVMGWTKGLAGINEPIPYLRDQIALLGPAANNAPANAPSSGLNGVVRVKVNAGTPQAALAINNAFDEAMEFEVANVANQSLQGAIKANQATLGRVYLELLSGKFPFGVTREGLQLQVNSLQNNLASLTLQQPVTGFTLLQYPSVITVTKIHHTSALNRRPVRAAAGLGVGVILGALAALGLWLLDKRLKTAKRAQAAFAYPIVAEIPSDSSDATEPYRMLWLSVFREPLPLPPAEQNQRLYEGEDPVLEAGVGGRPGQAGTP